MDRGVADPVIGRLLDRRYLVGDRVARGGMATVYEALDVRLDRPCAVKVMHSGLGDDEDFAHRFVQEARAAARLSHPNVVAVYDQGDDEGTLFLVMEFVPGRTLRDLVREEAPMPPRRALTLLEPVLAALAAAHQSRLVHRDVKPENVLISTDGRVKVADFGLARAVGSDTRHTATNGVLIGTVSYLAPELVVDGRADARSDVYSAGVLLYEMLTGRKPHEGDSPIQVAYKHVHEDVPPPSRAVDGIPPYLDALVARATARDRANRPADAKVLGQQVRRVRVALESGALDDAELTSDLLPVTRVAGDSIDYLSSEPAVDPATTRVAAAVAAPPAGRADAREQTTVIASPPPPLTGHTARGPVMASGRSPAPPGGQPAGASPSEQDARARQRRRSRRGMVLLVLVLLLAVAAGAAGWYVGVARYTATPAVLNLSAARAEDRVAAQGLGFDVVGREFSETVSAGAVLRTEPAPGERVLKDGTVEAVLSRGPERFAVPEVVGLPVRRARSALSALSLAVDEVTRSYDERVAAGRVLAVSPEEGTELRRDASVDLVVSLGREPIDVPDLTGQPVEDATRTLRGLRLRVEVAEEFDDDVKEGLVVSQTPTGGTLFRRDQVSLVVSKGPELVEVPRVVPMGVEAALERIEDAGFVAQLDRSTDFAGIQFTVGQSPAAGSMLPRGGTVVIRIV